MKRFFSFVTLLSLFFLLAPTAQAQYEEDTKTVDSTIEALYDVISGPAGVERDWDRFQNLFHATATLIPIVVTPDSTFTRNMTPAQYAQVAGPWLFDNGFFEKELARTQEEYGHMVHMFSTYGSYKTSEDKEPYDRGINSIQLMTNGDRWFVVNIMWDAESMGAQIPEKYLASR